MAVSNPMERVERTPKAIGQRLAATREALGLKPSQFADQARIARNTFSQWESGKVKPGLRDAIKLADAHNLTLDWIYLGDASGLPFRIASKLAAPLLSLKSN